MLASGLNFSLGLIACLRAKYFPLGLIAWLRAKLFPWGYKHADLLIRHENPADEIGQQTATSEEDEKQPNYANKSCVNSEIFSYATANASDLFVF